MATAGTAPTELGDKRIRDLLMQYAVPAIIAMTASSLIIWSTASISAI